MMGSVHRATGQNGVERVYRAESARLYRSLVGATGSAEVAAEAMAETFAQLISRGDEVRDARAWVWRTAFRVARGELASRCRPETLVPPQLVEEPQREVIRKRIAMARKELEIEKARSDISRN